MEEHPTERELQGLREWLLTQQWLQQQHHAEPAGGGAAGRGAAPAAQPAGVEQQAMQLVQQQGWQDPLPPGHPQQRR